MSGLCAMVDFSRAAVSRELVGSLAMAGTSTPGALPRVLGRSSAVFACLGSRLEKDLEAHEHAAGFFLVASDARLDNREELAWGLREELRSLGRDSDEAGSSSLILAAYLRWGEGLAEHLLGDFAFILWSEKEQRLLSGRDPLGVKSLHYCRVGESLIVATEVAQILAHPAVSSDLDADSLGDFLCDNIQDPCRTLFKSIRRLPPAHVARAERRGLSFTRYWRPEPGMRPGPKDEGEAGEAILEILEEAVSDRLQRDSGPVSISISGGLDSCSVAALAREKLRPEDLVFGSLTFPSLSSCDERSWVETMAGAMGCEAEWIDAEEQSRLTWNQAASPNLEAVDESWEACYTEMLGRLRQRGCTVLLTGIAGDDFLGGSSSVYADRLLSGEVGVIPELWRYARGQGKNPLNFLYCYLAEPLVPVTVGTLVRRCMGRGDVCTPPPWLDSGFVRHTGLRKRSRFRPRAAWGRKAEADIAYNVEPGCFGSTVHWLDRQAARFGIEARHPYLDRRLAELVLSIQPRLLFKLGTYKPLLRRAMQGRMPESLRVRPDKTRVGGFFDARMARSATSIRELFLAPRLEELGIVDARELRRGLERFLTKPDAGLRPIWYAIMLELWLRKYYNSSTSNFEARTETMTAWGLASASPAQA